MAMLDITTVKRRLRFAKTLQGSARRQTELMADKFFRLSLKCLRLDRQKTIQFKREKQ
jgi:hypothetical protein